MRKLNRRSALVGGLVASALAVLDPAAEAAPSVDIPTNPPALHPTDPLPLSWQDWRGQHVGATIEELIEAMVTETSVNTVWASLEAEVTRAKNNLLGQWETDGLRRWMFDAICYLDTFTNRREMAVTEQAALVGYALAMTRASAPLGPEAWHRAALHYAGLVEMTKAEETAVYDRLEAVTDENSRLLAFLHPSTGSGPAQEEAS